jgi:hypothetical protein
MLIIYFITREFCSKRQLASGLMSPLATKWQCYIEAISP